jgi:hypothetical protein
MILRDVRAERMAACVSTIRPHRRKRIAVLSGAS